MRLHQLDVNFHRTVRVPEGRAATNLPPSLGRMRLFKVADYRQSCPGEWDSEAYFMALHDSEAMWIQFNALTPTAVLVGAGGVNALTGQKLGTKLEVGNYLVCPPQPWLDGWKDVDGTVHQFVATEHKKGEGLTVGGQLIGKESLTGGIGLALFDATDDTLVTSKSFPTETKYDSSYGSHVMSYSCNTSASILKSSSVTSNINSALTRAHRSAAPHTEMGLGKGGRIVQHVYPDPYGLSTWKDTPTVVFAFYLVNAQVAEEITGEKVAKPTTTSGYSGPWFGLQDEGLGDVPGSNAFAGLKSAVFTGDTTNVQPEQAELSHASAEGEAETGANAKAAG